MEAEAIKSALMSLGIMGIIAGFVWYKWKDEILFNFHLIKAKINPTPEGDRQLMAEAFAPKQSFTDMVGGWFTKDPVTPEYDETDYFQSWQRNHPGED